MKNIFLDLDNTLICAEPFEDITDLGRFKERASHFDFKTMEDYYLICEGLIFNLFWTICLKILMSYMDSWQVKDMLHL